MMKNAVEVRGLTVVRGAGTVLDGLDLDIAAGLVTGLLGPSGCGKSTLLRSIVGVQQTHGGEVSVLGEPAGSAPLRSRIGYVTQAASVYDDLTVDREPPVLRAGARRATRPRSSGSSTAVDLGSHADAVVGELSGGQRSRASLAVALLGSPDLLVLDEPTVGLDPVLRRDLWRLFHELADGGATVLVSSHVMDEAERCDRLLLMRDGAILARRDTRPRSRRRAAPTTSRRRSSAWWRVRHERPRITLAVATRVLTQLRRDHRTLAMLLVLPCLLIIAALVDVRRALAGDVRPVRARRCSRCSRSS